MNDLVSRQLVMKTLCDRRCGDKPKGCPSGFCTESLAVDCIPSADVPDRKVGKWMHDADGLVWCYGCGFGKERSDERPYNYCPNCGAKMEVEE